MISDMLLADLPTNGLDSASAYSLMRTLRFACRGGYSCMAVLVQPSAEITNLLHKVMLLCKGAVIYYGALSYAEDYLREAGFVRPSQKPLPQFMEELSSKPELFYHTSITRSLALPIDSKHRSSSDDAEKGILVDETGDKSNYSVTVHLSLQDGAGNGSGNGGGGKGGVGVGGVVGVPSGMGDDVDGAMKGGKRYSAWSVLVAVYHSSPMYIPVAKEVEEIASVGGKNTDTEVSSSIEGREEYELHELKQSSKSMGWWYKQFYPSPSQQLLQCLHRQAILTWRNTAMWLDNFIKSLVLSFILGSLYWQKGTTAVDIRNQAGLLFFVIIYLLIASLPIIPTLFHERDVFYLHVKTRTIHPIMYYIAFSICYFPIIVIEVWLTITPMYGLAGLYGTTMGSDSYWYFFLLVTTGQYSCSCSCNQHCNNRYRHGHCLSI
jgi:hypothetical protein